MNINMKTISIIFRKNNLSDFSGYGIVFRRGDKVLPMIIDKKDFNFNKLGEYLKEGLEYLNYENSDSITF